MIERIGLRAAEFVATTARRVAGAADEVTTSDNPVSRHRLFKVALPVVAAGAATLAAAASKAAGDSAPSKSPASRSGSNGSRPSTSSRSKASSKARGATKEVAGKAKDAAEKTREELYELAKKADIPGRSSMSKDELAKALGK